MGNDNPTLMQTPAPAPSSSTLHTLDSTSTSISAPETVLRNAEVDQSRRMAITGVVFNVFAIVTSPLYGGHPTAKHVALASFAAATLNNAWLWWGSADARRYKERTILAYFVVSGILNIGIVYFLGVFGPILAMFVLNVYSACLNYDRRVAFVALLGSIFTFLAVAVPIGVGWIDDHGALSATAYVGTNERILIMIAFTAFLALVYSQGRNGREVIVKSLSERDAAVRTASHREALFLEARRDLENALQAGGLGRFTDQTLGSYKLGAIIARGGMGEVYEATSTKDGSRAAVKMLLPEVLARADFVRRFLREVRIAASLDSPHVVTVLEVGDESAPLPYLAMERLEGDDLAHILRQKERLGLAEAADVARQVGRGLRVANAGGIVHRDLKPQNLFLTKSGTWKILDFGISKLGDQVSTLTEGAAVGTPQYMAPEQARNGEVGPPADMYGLGAVVYRAVTGCQPFKGADVAEVLVAVMTSMPIRPSALADLPREIDHVLAIALAKNPKDRFESGEAFADALDAVAAGTLDPKLRRRATKLLDATPWREP